jgi:hypothetical protein
MVLEMVLVLEIIKKDYFYKLHEVTFGFKRLWKIIFFRISYKLCLPNKDYFLSSLFFEKISIISQQFCVPNIA